MIGGERGRRGREGRGERRGREGRGQEGEEQLDSANGYMRCVSSVTLTIRRSVKGYLQVDDAACSL